MNWEAAFVVSVVVVGIFAAVVAEWARRKEARRVFQERLLWLEESRRRAAL